MSRTKASNLNHLIWLFENYYLIFSREKKEKDDEYKFYIYKYII